MPFCPNCGKELTSENYCPYCGTRLRQPSSGLQPAAGAAPQLHKIGHRAALIAIWAVGIADLPLYYYLAYSGTAFYWAAGVLLFAVTIAATEMIYRDAKAINQLASRKVLDATLWSLMAFVLWEVAIPFYVFSRRDTALVS